MTTQPNNPLHGKTLESILTELVEYYGWEELGERIRVNCFVVDPTIKSSLTFLRKTPWEKESGDIIFKEFKQIIMMCFLYYFVTIS